MFFLSLVLLLFVFNKYELGINVACLKLNNLLMKLNKGTKKNLKSKLWSGGLLCFKMIF